MYILISDSIELDIANLKINKVYKYLILNLVVERYIRLQSILI